MVDKAGPHKVTSQIYYVIHAVQALAALLFSVHVL